MPKRVRERAPNLVTQTRKKSQKGHQHKGTEKKEKKEVARLKVRGKGGHASKPSLNRRSQKKHHWGQEGKIHRTRGENQLQKEKKGIRNSSTLPRTAQSPSGKRDRPGTRLRYKPRGRAKGGEGEH